MDPSSLPAVPHNCPGTSSESAGHASACAGCPNQAACATAPKGPDPDIAAIQERMRHIKHKLLVLSGKGGVGKSTISAQLAYALAAAGNQVGLLDIDICGPSVPRMLGLEGQEVHQSATGWSPVYVSENLGVMSIGFMLNDPNEAVVWRGPRKNGLIKQFLKDVDWGTLDYLVVDAPPGTSDEHISITQCLKDCGVSGAVIVTTPQEVSLADVRKELSFCKKVGLRVLGVVENMSGLQVPVDKLRFITASGADVSEAVLAALQAVPDAQNMLIHAEVFCSGSKGPEAMAAAWGVPYLGAVPMDSELTRAGEAGLPLAVHALAGPAINSVVRKVVALCGRES